MRIAVFGLGIIGSVWAQQLRADGHEVRAWNRTPRPDFPGFVEDAAEAATGCDIAAIVVSDGTAVSAVLDAILPVLEPGTIVAQHSTIGVEETLGIAARVEAAGGRFLDMPFSGSKAGAENRQCNFYVGGDEAVVEEIRPAYRKLAKSIISVGRHGEAMSLKLAFNVLTAGLGQSLCEAVRLAEVGGVSRDLFFRAFETHFARCGYTDLKRPLLEKGEYGPQFSVKLMRKDVLLAQGESEKSGLNLPLVGLLADIYQAGGKAGLDECDLVSLIRLLE